MRLLIVIGALLASTIAEAYEYIQYRGPAAPLASDGTVMETPEVASARAAHLAMHAETMARLRKARTEDVTYESNGMTTYETPMNPPAMTQKRPRQRSLAPLGRDGRVVDTPEVAEAKAAHLAAHARAASKASEFYDWDALNGRRNLIYLTPLRITYNQISPVGYRGPPAPLGPDGRVIDTPEVSRAREAHMKAHARAVAIAAQNNLYY